MKRKLLKKSFSMAVMLTVAAQALLPSTLCARAASVKATDFTFSDSQIAVSEGNYDGYEVDGTSLTINKSGTYQISGNCGDGNIKIKKGTEDVTLILDGLTLSSSDTAPICCGKSSQVFILANSGTVNSLADASFNNDDNFPDNTNAENAVIKCKDGSNVTIGGSGTLQITANGKNGIKSGSTTDTEGDASLSIEDVSLQITASVNDAVNAESLLTVKSGNIEIQAADDALHSDYNLIIGEKDTAKAPNITITSCYEGLEGANVAIYSGNIEIHAQDDGINAANSDLSGYAFTLDIAGGNLYVDTEEGDGIDSNGTLTISGGKTEIFSTSQGSNGPLDSDGTFCITGGTVFAVGNSGMAQTPAANSQNYVTFSSSGFGGGPGGGWGGPGGPGGRFGQQNSSQSGSVNISSGDSLVITDSSQTELYSSAAVRSANYVLYSDDALLANSKYTLNINGTSSIEAMAKGNVTQKPDRPQEPPTDLVTPDNPDNPTDPDTPDNPDNPTDPDTPDNPDNPSDPGQGDVTEDNTAVNISKSAKVSLSKTRYVYNGKQKKPAVTVWFRSKKLKNKVDYTITYKNNINVGTASVVIKGIGNYTGTITKAFTIVPQGTSLSGKFQVKPKKFTAKWKKQSKSITGYELQYSTTSKFTKGKTITKKIGKASASKYTFSNIKTKNKCYIRIRTYKTVNGKKYVSSWSKTKSIKTKK